MTNRLSASSLAVVVAIVVTGLGVSADQAAQPFGQDAYQPGSGIENPKLVKKVEPKYTSEALRARIQGEVELEAVVGVNGMIGDIRVIKSLDKTFGLDEKALEAARGWVFTPGTRDGKAIPVIVRLILEFKVSPQRLKSGDEFVKDAYLLSDRGVVAPKVTTRTEPKYTSDAMRAKLQGIVEVDIVIDAQGKLDRAQIGRSLDALYGLDEKALECVKGWKFEPGTLNGAPVPIAITVTLEFRLH